MANYELRIETAEMKKCLDMLSTVINRKNSLPIMANACIRFDRQRKLFTMTGSNTEQWLTVECWRPDEKADKGQRPWMFLDKDAKDQPLDAFCISVEDFREAFATLPTLPAACYLKLDQTGAGSIRVNYGKGEFTMPVKSAIDYPAIPTVAEKNGEQREGISPLVKFSIETSRLLPVILAARVCSASDELRPVMNTVCVDCFHDHCIVVASDGHSLYRRNLDTGMGWLKYGEFAADQSAKLLIPTQSMSPLSKAFSTAESLTVTADTQRICFESGDGTARLTTVTIDGRYPNYESVIPKDNQHRLVLDRQELSATLRRISLFSNESSNMCAMRRRDEHAVFQADDSDFGRNADEQVTIINPDTSLPDGFEIGFKISTMQQLLGCITGDNIVLEISDPSRAMLIKEDSHISGLILLIMPMLMNG